MSTNYSNQKVSGSCPNREIKVYYWPGLGVSSQSISERSIRGGMYWSSAGLPDTWGMTVREMVFDIDFAGTIWLTDVSFTSRVRCGFPDFGCYEVLKHRIEVSTIWHNWLGNITDQFIFLDWSITHLARWVWGDGIMLYEYFHTSVSQSLQCSKKARWVKLKC